MPHAPYKVVYHVGDDIGPKTRVASGVATLDGGSLNIAGQEETLDIPLSSLRGADMFRLDGLGRMLRLTTADGRTIFLTVVRLNLFGYFVVVNFFKAGELYERIKAGITTTAADGGTPG
jgi:hypothetical protein